MKELSEVVSDLDKGGASAERVTVLTLSCLVPYPPSAGWSPTPAHFFTIWLISIITQVYIFLYICIYVSLLFAVSNVVR